MNDVAAGFAEELTRQGKKIFEAAEPSMTRLAAIAESLKMPVARAHIEAGVEGLRRPTFTMIVFGRFNTGKSTFLNILLGRLERPLDELPRRIGAPLPMDDMPVNARLTTIKYGETPSVAVVRADGKREVRSLRWFLDNSPLRSTEQENEAAFGDIQAFELTYPFENGRAGIVLIDTPGTDEAPDRTDVAMRALDKADAAILLLNTVAPASKGEIDFAREMIARGLTNYFVVFNRYNGRVVDERLRHFAWDKLVRGLKQGPEYAGQDFADQKIYFVDALSALEGRLTNAAERVAASGIEAFESALSQFYETERRKVHVQRWTDQAIGQATKIETFVAQQVPTLMVEREDFQRRFEEAQPKIRELEARKDRPRRLFNRFQQRAVDGLLVGFQDFVFKVSDDLPKALETKELTTIKDVSSLIWSSFSRRKQEEVAQEVGRLVSDYFSECVREWESAEPPAAGVKQILSPLTDDLMNELREEVTRTERDFEQLKLSLSDSITADARSGGPAEPEGDWWKRIAPAAAGLIFGPDMAASGALTGWKGFGKGLIVHMGAFLLLAVIGAPATLPFLIATWIASFFLRGLWRGHDLQREVKANAAKAFAEGMRQQIDEARAKLTASIATMTAEFEAAVSAGYAEEIDQQIEDLLKMQRESALSRDDKAALIAQYGKVKTEVARHITTLTYVRSLAAI